MAKVVEQHIIIKISKLVKDDSSDTEVFVDDSTVDSLLSIIEELVDNKTLIVELVKDSE